MTEFAQKFGKISDLLDQHELDGLILQNVSSFAWATCGAAAYVNSAVTNGVATLLITPTARHLFSNNIEATRLEQEEGLRKQGWEFHITPWYKPEDELDRVAAGLKLGSDGPYPGALDLSYEMARVRAELTPEEGERFRALGRLCASAMDSAIRAVRPGQTEYEIAGLLAQETQRRGAQPIVNLIATDRRIFSFRHPLPTDKKLDRYAMLVLCGRKWGLVASITRLVHFGQLPDEVRRKREAVAQVDATFIAATRPGRLLGDIFQEAVDAYRATGYPDEWQLHHQGGPVAYEPREYVGVPGCQDVVSLGQAYAWNPSITGAKSEDTFLVSEPGNELLTRIDGWPQLTVVVGGQEMKRPDILVVE